MNKQIIPLIPEVEIQPGRNNTTKITYNYYSILFKFVQKISENMVSKEQISKVIFEVIRDYNSEVPVDRRILESPDSVLYGPSGNLDSLGLVNFVISAEQKIEEVFNTPVTLADEKAMSQRTSPFKSVESLVNYISFLLEENNDK